MKRKLMCTVYSKWRNFKPMLISHAEKTYDCNAESKFKVSETKHPKEEATKGKADTNSTQQCSVDPTHGQF